MKRWLVISIGLLVAGGVCIDRHFYGTGAAFVGVGLCLFIMWPLMGDEK